MTSNDKRGSKAQNDDSHVNTTPKRHTESTEFRRHTAQALNTTPRHTLFGPLHDPYSEAVADWNIGYHSKVREGAYRASLDTSPRQRSCAEDSRRRSLSRKVDVPDLRQDEGSAASMGFFKRSHDKERKLKSSHGEKPLPAASNGDSSHRRIISDTSHAHNVPERPARPAVGLVDNTPAPAHVVDDTPAHAHEEKKTSHPHDSGVHSDLGRERGYLVKDSTQPIDLTGIVDLSHTEDTDVSVTYAPQVTHETRHINTHEIFQESITREIHNHHIYHRVLPVLDFEILPAKHYVPLAGGGLTEIPESEISGGAAMSQSVQKILENAFANAMPKQQQNETQSLAPRRFTARTFEGTEGDYKEYIGDDGIPRTEQWWVHPPTIAKTFDPAGNNGVEPPLTFHFHWEDQSGGSPAGNVDSSQAQQQATKTKRWPPPRGASLGKTSIPLQSTGVESEVNAAAKPLPLRTLNGGPAPPPVVGLAH